MDDLNTVATCCEEYINGQREDIIPKELAKGISSDSIKLLTLVESLGIYLTSADVTKRVRGTKLLSTVLSQFNNHNLINEEVSYLVSFYCDRLKDSPLVTPHVLQGILALVRFQTITDNDVVSIVRGLFGEIHNQALQQFSRNLFYSLMFIFLRDYGSVITQISSEFLLGFIQGMDGEKDPRNLLLVFDCIPLLTKHCELDVLVEELFEVVSCYFPINFNPSCNETVSKEELVLGLRKCLTSTPKFAEFCLPLLLDKISSDLEPAKQDALLTLKDSMRVYGVEFYSPYVQMLWGILKREVFYPVSEDTQSLSLLALTELCKTLSTNHKEMKEFAEIINKDIRHHMCEPELKLIRPAVCLLAAIAEGSIQGRSAVGETFLPLLTKQLIDQTQTSKKHKVIEAILRLLQSFKSFPFFAQTESLVSENCNTLHSLLLSLLADHTHTELATVAIVTIASVISLQCIPMEEVNKCVELLMSLLFTVNINKELSKECIQTLGLISQLYSQVIKDTLLPSLLTKLYEQVVSTCHDIIIETLPSLISLLEHTFKRSDHSNGELVSESLSAIISQELNNDTREFIHHKIIPDLFKLCLNFTDILNDVIMSHIGVALHHHCLALEEEISTQWTKEVINLFISGINPLLNPLQNEFKPLQGASPWQQTQLVFLLTSVLSSTPSESLNETGIDLLWSLVELSLHTKHSLSQLWSVKSCHCIVNKMNLQDDVVTHLYDRLWSIINDVSYEKRYSALTVWLWVTKGLIMRSHQLGISAVNKLLELFSDELIGRRASDGFYLLLIDSSVPLARGNIRLFYKQQVFTYCVPELVKLFNLSNDKKGKDHIIKENTLHALSHLMSSVPKQVLLPELPKLFPLLLESVHNSIINEVGVVLSSLEAIYSLVLDAPSVMGGHLTSLVKPLLSIAQSSNYMKVRIAALRCIGVLTTLPVYEVYPYQSLVIRELALCLDDKKRLVRKEAVTSRSEWYMLGCET